MGLKPINNSVTLDILCESARSKRGAAGGVLLYNSLHNPAFSPIVKYIRLVSPFIYAPYSHNYSAGVTIMPRITTGRCHHCNIRFVWQGEPLLRHALCPLCKRPLNQTTHLFQGTSTNQKPISSLRP
jgi:hypothetical protein